MPIDPIIVTVKTGRHRRGDAFPMLDFSYVEAHGIQNKAGVVACNNEQLWRQIEKSLADNPFEASVPYLYYAEDK